MDASGMLAIKQVETASMRSARYACTDETKLRELIMKTLNIGLANPFTGELNTVDQTITEALKCVRGIEDIAVRRSATEPTVIIRFKQAVDSLNKIATALDQDCIAVYDDETGIGELYGERASDWAPFNPEYFLTI